MISRARIYLINKMNFIATQSTTQTPFAEMKVAPGSEVVQLRFHDKILERLKLKELFRCVRILEASFVLRQTVLHLVTDSKESCEESFEPFLLGGLKWNMN